MKRMVYAAVLGGLITGLVGYGLVNSNEAIAEERLASVPGPIVTVATPMVKMDPKADVVIMGAGFQSGQEVKLLFTTMDGSKGDIGYALKPPPVANSIGTWMTTWSCGRYIAKKLIKPGAHTVTATDSEYNFLSHAPVVFYSK